jgi:hypothetical protein
MATKRKPREFCNGHCRDSYICDRIAGAIYSPFKLDGVLVGHDDACRKLRLCRYCIASLTK